MKTSTYVSKALSLVYVIDLNLISGVLGGVVCVGSPQFLPHYKFQSSVSSLKGSHGLSSKSRRVLSQISSDRAESSCHEFMDVDC